MGKTKRATTPATGAGKKGKAATGRKRPSTTNVASAENVNPRARKNERSVMASVEQEPTNDGAKEGKKAAATTPSTPQMVPVQPKQKDPVMKTVMLPPSMPPLPPASAPPAPPPAQLQPVILPAAQPPLPPAPRPPPMAVPSMINQQQQQPPQPLQPLQQQQQQQQQSIPPAPPQQMAQMAPVVQHTAMVAKAPVDPLMMDQPTQRKLSRERDVSVDEGEGSARKKKSDVINSWIRLVLMNGVEGLRKEYRDSPNEAPMDKATAFTDNPTRNRYHNIPCCDTSRVKLPDDPHYYLHANLVSSGPNPRRFVCTQAPLQTTIEDFWKMVIVSGLEFIVMLCEVVEKGKTKSAEYFPIKIGDCMKIGKLCTVTKESVVDLDKNLQMATMRISKIGDTAVAMTVKHIHWRNWPDHGVPDNFHTPFRLLTTLKTSVKPIVVHCSAGVGRTGTLVLILIILESLRLPDFLGVPRLLTKLREERYKSIQTELQYIYVHRCVLEYLVLKKYEYPKDLYAKFCKDYATAIEGCEKA